MTTLTIHYADEQNVAELYQHHQGEGWPQPVVFDLDVERGILSVDIDPEIGDGRRPKSVDLGLVQRWTLHTVPTAAAANRLLDDMVPYARRLLDDVTIELDAEAGDHYAELGPDARDAAEEIVDVLHTFDTADNPSEFVQFVDAEEWFGVEGRAEVVARLGITPDMDDDQIERMADAESGEAIRMIEQPTVLRGAERYLLSLRDNLD